MDPKVVRYAEVIPVEARPGIWRRTLAWGQRAMLLESTFDAGADLAEHSHPHEQITYLLSGELEMRVGDKAYSLAPGDSVLIPPGVRHGATAHKKTVVIDAFSPPNEDFK